MKTLLLLIIATFSLISLSAQPTGVITGQVIDMENGKVLPHAVVRVNGAYAYADEFGQFPISTQTTEVFLYASYIGYAETWDTVHLPTSETVKLQLAATPISLSTILVLGDSRRRTAGSTVYNDQTKRLSQPADIGDLLADQPGFSLIKRGGYALDPVLRSFQAEQLNIVFDGGVQVVHACPGRMDPISTHVNPEAIRHIEIIKGPFSVRHGQVLGGTININTIEEKVSNGWSGFVETGLESNGNNGRGYAGLSYGSQQVDLQVTGGIKDFGNYQNGDGLSIPSAFRTSDYGLTGTWRPDDDQVLRAHWRQSFGRDILHPALMMDTRSDDASTASLDYNRTNMSDNLYSLSAKVYASQVDHIMSNENRPNRMMVDALATVQSRTLGGKVEATWHPTSKTILYTGVDMRYVGRTGFRDRVVKRNMMSGEELPQPMNFRDPIWQDAQILNSGAFAELRWLINERLAWNTGLRTDLVKGKISDPATEFQTYYGDPGHQTDVNWSANTSLNMTWSDRWTTQVALGRGTRSANMIERYINHFAVGIDGFEYVGNPFLRPEANHQLQVDVTYANNILEVGGSVFYSFITDYITATVDSTTRRKYMPAQPPAYVRRFTNAEAAKQAGFEAYGKVLVLPSLSWSGNISYTYAQNLDWNEPLPQIAPLRGVSTLEFRKPNWWARIDYRFASRQDRVSVEFGESPTPGFSKMDLGFGCTIYDDVQLGFSVLNIWNTTYYEHLNRPFRNMPESGILYEPGRNFTAMVRYDFGK